MAERTTDVFLSYKHTKIRGAFESDVELIAIDQELLHERPGWLFWGPPLVVLVCVLFCHGDDRISGTVTVQGS